jgi:hypothetical protein
MAAQRWLPARPAIDVREDLRALWFAAGGHDLLTLCGEHGAHRAGPPCL